MQAIPAGAPAPAASTVAADAGPGAQLSRELTAGGAARWEGRTRPAMEGGQGERLERRRKLAQAVETDRGRCGVEAVAELDVEQLGQPTFDGVARARGSLGELRGTLRELWLPLEQRWQQQQPQPIASGVELVVGGVVDRLEPDALRRFAQNALLEPQQRPHQVAEHRPDARQPERPGALQQAEQQGLELVVSMVRSRHPARVRRVSHRLEKRVALRACRLLERHSATPRRAHLAPRRAKRPPLDGLQARQRARAARSIRRRVRDRDERRSPSARSRPQMA